MLIDLVISNLKLIKQANVHFQKGLQVISGESGAGKSMLLNALRLIAGERVKGELNQQELETKIEAIFDISHNDNVIEVLRDMHIECEDNLLILRRHIDPQSRSKTLINGTLVPLKDLKKVSSLLLDIHSQNSHQSLLNDASHLGWLDASQPKIQKQLNSYSQVYEQYKEARQAYTQAVENTTLATQELDFIRFQLDELEQITLDPQHHQQLLNDRKQLIHLEQFEDINQRIQALLDGEEGPLIKMQNLEKYLGELAQIQGQFEPLVNISREINLLLSDLHQSYYQKRPTQDRLDRDLESIENELYQMEKLLRKYNISIGGLLKLKQDLQHKVELSENKDFFLKNLQQALEIQEEAIQKEAQVLHKVRASSKIALEQQITKELQELGIKHAQFEVQLSPADYGPLGNDVVQFRLQTNKGLGLSPLAEIVSGGELSRVMLALKTVLTSRYFCSTFIFDEVDANLGGETAVVVGKKLQHLAHDHQILCITHLPQIAALANQHIRVSKHDDANNTWTHVEELDQQERVIEIARMLGGDAQHSLARQHAQELLGLAEVSS